MDKQNTVYPYNGILYSYKKEKVLIHTITQAILENIMLSEIRQTQKTKNYMFPLIGDT